jgi:hypothetical protein
LPAIQGGGGKGSFLDAMTADGVVVVVVVVAVAVLLLLLLDEDGGDISFRCYQASADQEQLRAARLHIESHSPVAR